LDAERQTVAELSENVQTLQESSDAERQKARDLEERVERLEKTQVCRENHRPLLF
jgi:uncharacterized NAD(P)/FAD-binding protein YdhS